MLFSMLRKILNPIRRNSLDDITATPRAKTREEIIAEAEAAAFAEQGEWIIPLGFSHESQAELLLKIVY